HFASHVGSGFDDRSLAEMGKRLEPLKTKTRPFVDEPERNAPTTWVKPELVAEVSFHSWTDDGRLRAPVFVRLRDDLDAKKLSHSRVGRNPAAKVERGAPLRSLDPRVSDRPNKLGTPGWDDITRQLDNTRNELTLAIGKHAIKVTNLNRVYWPADPSVKQ